MGHLLIGTVVVVGRSVGPQLHVTVISVVDLRRRPLLVVALAADVFCVYAPPLVGLVLLFSLR